jgi:predicted membrane protein
MGNTTLDLSRATMAGEMATVDVSVLMGGVQIIVPPDWEVFMQVVPFMGGCVDARRSPSQAPARKLFVRGRVILGGVTILG